MNLRKCLALAAAILPLAGHAADSSAPADASARHMPDLVVDDSPVEQAGYVASYADALEAAQKAVVTVYSTKTLPSAAASGRLPFGLPQPDRPSEQQGLGSGVIISPDGYILTNNHVVDGADKIEVQLPDESKLTATVIGTDANTDIAVIKIEAKDLPVITFANSDRLRVGDVVFAIGNPLAVGQTVTMGIVSAKGRHIGILGEGGYEDFIQTDAAINMGNSGGALVDAKGRLVGVNSAIVSTNGSELGGSIGIGFAVPVNLATRIVRSLIETGKVSRGYLGISVDGLTPELAQSFKLDPETKGVVVTYVEEGAPAEAAGLALDDVLVSVDGKPVTTHDELRLMIAQKLPDSVVELKFFRNGEEHTVQATLGLFPDDNAKPDEILPGIGVGALTDDLRRSYQLEDGTEGLLVTRVDAESRYSSKLEEGMVITRINRDYVTNLSSARKAIVSGINRFYVYRQGSLTPSIIGIEVP